MQRSDTFVVKEPRSLEDAFHIIETTTAYNPYGAIAYVSTHPPTKIIQDRIIFALTHAFGRSHSYFFAYLMIAENHLSKQLVAPLIAFLITDATKLDNAQIYEAPLEQAQFVLGKLVKKYPDYTMHESMRALDMAFAKGVDANYFYLFGIFSFINYRRYTKWFIEVLLEKHFLLKDAFLEAVMQLGIKKTIPVIRKTIDEEQWSIEDVDLEFLEYYYNRLVKGMYPEKKKDYINSQRKNLAWDKYWIDGPDSKLTDAEVTALYKIPFPHLLIDPAYRFEDCYCGKKRKDGTPKRYKFCCKARDLALINLPRFAK